MKHHCFAALLFLGVCGTPFTRASAQNATPPPSVAAAGAVCASNTTCRLHATLGQAAIGHRVGSSITTDLGFWHPLHRTAAVSQPATTDAALASVTVAPNPLVGATQIALRIPQADHVSLTLFNLLGQPVRSLLNGPQSEGTSALTLDGRELPAGTYTLVLTYRGIVSNTSITIMR